MSGTGMMEAQSGDSADLRTAPRYSLILRTAKLLCEGGEYVCVVRDVSESGVRVRLYHDCPPDRFLALELGNGDRFAMERMWQNGNEAGFRFSASIDVDAFIEEPNDLPRRPVRLRVQRPALVTARGRDIHAMLVDLSQQGGCVEAGSQIPLKQQVRVELAGMPVRFGHVCWRRGFTHGLVFQQGFRLDEFARLAFAVQPFAVTEGVPRDQRIARFV